LTDVRALLLGSAPGWARREWDMSRSIKNVSDSDRTYNCILELRNKYANLTGTTVTNAGVTTLEVSEDIISALQMVNVTLIATDDREISSDTCTKRKLSFAKFSKGINTWFGIGQYGGLVSRLDDIRREV